MNLSCSDDSTRFTRRSEKREASSQNRSATNISFAKCSSKTLSFNYLLSKKKTLSPASSLKPKKISHSSQKPPRYLAPQPESPQKPSWRSVSFPPKPPVLRSNQPCSHSQSPPILQKFGTITLNHNPPPFLQVSRTHPSKGEKNDYSSPCSK
jgi:hypothetical protein